jgi:2-polyprenyl-3-methyl-5-hydroxy-6-metoxy-1,4-benzoquinol methylase
MITTWSAGHADEHMAEAILVEQVGLIRRHPWWRARARLTLALLDRLGVRAPARVLDAGCGWGVTLAALERRGYSGVGMDISRRALEMLEHERPGRALIEADLSRSLPEGLEPYDAVLALDVIEHLDDDRAAIERLGWLTRPGGVVIVSVPALPEMFSEFDRIQGHRRRYLPETLRLSFAQTGLELERTFWWGAWLVPTLRRQRRRPLRAVPGEPAAQTYSRYLRLPPWPIPIVLRMAFALEQGLSLAGKLTTGTSLFAVARRIDPIVARPGAPAPASREGMVGKLSHPRPAPT